MILNEKLARSILRLQLDPDFKVFYDQLEADARAATDTYVNKDLKTRMMYQMKGICHAYSTVLNSISGAHAYLTKLQETIDNGSPQTQGSTD